MLGLQLQEVTQAVPTCAGATLHPKVTEAACTVEFKNPQRITPTIRLVGQNHISTNTLHICPVHVRPCISLNWPYIYLYTVKSHLPQTYETT